jgi:DNA-binding GntR family transcriptional regulator
VVIKDNGDDSNFRLARQASEFLKSEIISGQLKPGTNIAVSEISEGIYSAADIREGLSRLMGTQLVFDADDGFKVADQSSDDLDDLRHTRFLLEGVALRDSIINGDSAWERSVTVSLEQLQDITPAAWLTSEAAQIRKSFHRALISASGLKRIRAFLDTIYDQCSWYSISNRGGGCTDFSGHKALAEAALARDPDAASEQLRMLLFPVAPANGTASIDN